MVAILFSMVTMATNMAAMEFMQKKIFLMTRPVIPESLVKFDEILKIFFFDWWPPLKENFIVPRNYTEDRCQQRTGVMWFDGIIIIYNMIHLI